MSELDPNTNLPVDNSLEEQKRVLKSFKNTRNRRPSNIGGSQRVQGSFGDYKPDQQVTSDRNFNEVRAQNQTFLELTGKTAMNTLGVVAGGVVSSVGFVRDMPFYLANTFKENEETPQYNFERNAISKAGKGIEDFFFDNFEVYQTDQAQNGGLNPFNLSSRIYDGTFWATQVPSIASTVSLMFPAFAGSTAVRLLGKAANWGKGVTRGADLVASSMATHHTYKMMEGFDVMDRNYQKLLDEGYGHTDAKKEAGKAASSFYNMGYANMWKDLVQWGALTRGFNYASRNATNTLLSRTANTPFAQQLQAAAKRNPTASAKEISKNAGMHWTKQAALNAGLESVEEFNIQLQKNLATSNMDRILGLEEGNTRNLYEHMFGSRAILDELGNKETQNAMLSAFIGGPLITGAGRLTNKLTNIDTKVQLAKEAELFEQENNAINDELKKFEQLAAEGKQEQAEKSLNNLIVNMALKGIMTPNGQIPPTLQQGRLAIIREQFEALKNLNESELESLGFGQESIKNAEKAIEEFDKLEKIYNEQMNQNVSSNSTLNDMMNLFITEARYKKQSAKERGQKIRTKLSEFFDKGTVKEILENLEVGSANNLKKKSRLFYLKKKLKELNADNFNEAFTGTMNPVRSEMMIAAYNEQRAAIESGIKFLEQEIKEFESSLTDEASEAGIVDESSPKAKYSKAQKLLNNQLKESVEYDNLMDSLINDEIETNLNDSLIKEYLDTNRQNQILERKKYMDDEFVGKMFTNFVANEFESDNFLRIGDEVFKVIDENGTKKLQKYNPKTRQFSDTKRYVTKKDIDTGIVPIKPDNLISEEDKESIIKDLEDALEKEDITSVLNNLDALFISGFQDSSDRLTNKIKKKIDEVFENVKNDRTGISRIAEKLNKAESLPKEIQDYYNDKLNKFNDEIAKRRNGQIEAISNMMTRHKENIKNSVDKLEALTKELSTVQDNIDKYTTQLSDINTTPNEGDVRSYGAGKAIYQDGKWFKVKKDGTASKVEIKAQDKVNTLSETYKKLSQDIRESISSLEARKVQINKEIRELKEYQSEIKKRNKALKETIELVNEYKHVIPADLLTDEVANSNEKIDNIEKLLLAKYDLLEADSAEQMVFIDNLVTNMNRVVNEIEGYINNLKDLAETSDFIQYVIKQTYEEVMTNVDISALNFNNPDATTNKILLELRTKLLRNFSRAKPYDNLNAKQQRVLNDVRNHLKQSTELKNIIDFPTEPFNTFLEKFKPNSEVIELYQAYINYKHKISRFNRFLEEFVTEVRKGVLHDEKTGKGFKNSEEALHDSRRLPQYVFKMLASNGLSNLRAYNYNKFVNSISASEVSVEITTLEKAGVELSEEDKAFYGDDTQLVALIVDKDGKYYKQDKSTSDTFDKDNNMWSPLVHPTTTKVEFAQTGRTIDAMFPGLSNDQRIKKVNELVEKKRVDYEKFYQDAILEINDKGALRVNAIGKNPGIPNYLNEKELQPVKNVVNVESIEVIREDGFTQVGDSQIVAKKGTVYVTTKEGNVIPIVERKFTNQEANTIVELLDAHFSTDYSKNGDTNRTKDETSAARKEGLKNLFEQLEFYTSTGKRRVLEIDFKNNKIRIGNKSFKLLPTNKSGNYISGEGLSSKKIILEAVKEGIVNINADKLKDNIEIKVPVFKDGELTTEKYSSYKDFVIDTGILSTRVSKPTKGDITEVGGVVRQKIEYLNQNFIIEHKIGDQDYNNTHDEEKLGSKDKKSDKKESVKDNSSFIDDGQPKPGELEEAAQQLQEDLKKEASFTTDDLIPGDGIGMSNLSSKDISVTKQDGETNDTDNLESTEAKIKQIKADRKVELENVHDISKWSKNNDGTYSVGSIKYAPNDLENAPKDSFIVDSMAAEEFDWQIETKTLDEDGRVSYGDELNNIINAKYNAELKALDRETNTTTSQESTESTPTTSVETKVETKDDDLNLNEIKKDSESIMDDEEFQKQSQSNIITQSNFNKINKVISRTTGTKVRHLSKQQGIRFLNDVMEMRGSDKRYTEDTAPKGFNYNGQAYVIGDISGDTPFHEISHPIISEIFDTNNDLATELKKTLENDSEGSKILSETIEKYPELLDDNEISDAIYKEALTELMGRSALNTFNERYKGLSGVVNKLMDGIKQFFNRLFGNSVDISNLNQNTTMDELSSMLFNRRFKSGNDTLELQKNDVKEGVTQLFKENSELANIGTVQQYSEYLDTIFPDSKVKDIVYHASTYSDGLSYEEITDLKNQNKEITSENKFIEEAFVFLKEISEKHNLKTIEDFNNLYGQWIISTSDRITKNDDYYGFLFEYLDEKNENINLKDVKPPLKKLISKEEVLKNKKPFSFSKDFFGKGAGLNFGEGFYFGNSFEGVEMWAEITGSQKIYLAILDIKNLQTKYQNADKQEFHFAKEAQKRGYDALKVANELNTFDTFEYVVFEPEQIHILGNKQDIQGFKESVSKQTNNNSYNEIVTNNGKSLKQLGITEENWYNMPDSIKDNILNCK